MSLSFSRVHDVACDHVAVADAIDVLPAIHDACTNLVIWQRTCDRALQAKAAALLDDHGEPLRLDCLAAALPGALPGAMAAAGWPQAPCIAADIASLAASFARVIGCDGVSLRLEVITNDACRKFHADYVTVRLITSYAGPGSQWLRDGDAAAHAAGVPAEQLDVQQLPTGAVALFKGRRWSDTPIIHRSPPIAGTGQRRLVLVINPAEDKP